MPLISAGTPVEELLIFNSGYMDFGSNRMVDLQDITITISFTEKELRRLNSIKMAAHKRGTLKIEVKFKMSSMSHELFTAIFGTTTVDGAGELISITDGQQGIINPVMTCYVDDYLGEPIQFQISDALFTTNAVATSLEAFGTLDVTMTARDLSVFFSEEIDGFITVSEETFMSDNVYIALNPLQILGISDTTSMSDSLNVQEVYDYSVSDTTAMTDTPALTLH